MGFLAPWFLGGLAALGVPVFVHLLRRHVTTPRASQLANVLRARHAKLHPPSAAAIPAAVRAARCVASAAGAGVCQSIYPPRERLDANGKLLLMVLDNSFSMSAGSRFADAKQQALAVAGSEAAWRSSAQVMALGGRLEVLTQPITEMHSCDRRSRASSQETAMQISASWARGVRALAETVRTPIDLHLFSDMQRTAMPANFADMVLPGSVGGAASGGDGRHAAKLDGRERRCSGAARRPERSEEIARAAR